MKHAPRRGDRCLPRDRTGTPSGTLEDFIVASSHEDATAGAQDQDLRPDGLETTLSLKPGDFCLLPACLGRVTLTAEMQTEFLHVQGCVTKK